MNNNNNMDSMLNVYLFETNGLIEHLEEILINCEKQNCFDEESINEIFRIMHTIKGSSAMMQFAGLTTVCHKVEDLFAYVRENGLRSENNEELFELMFESNDFIKAEIARVENNEILTTDIGTFEQKINGFFEKISQKYNEDKNAVLTEQASAEPQKNKEAVAKAKLQKCEQVLGEVPQAFAQKGFVYGVNIFFDEECQMENLRALMLVNSLLDSCCDIAYEPQNLEDSSLSADFIKENGFFVFLKNDDEMKKALKAIESFAYTKDYTIFTQNEAKKAKTEVMENKQKQTENNGQKAAAKIHHPIKQSLINVNLSKLNNLMDLMGEIVITESMVTAMSGMQQDGADNNFTKATRQLRKLTDELQEIIMSIRMVPISSVFQKMNRIVRDISKEQGKDVKLVLVGEETEVDKTIVDSMSDPLMHIVRNAMDHGIENREERAKTGKAEVGTITLSAQNTGGEILISVSDDGRGIDKEAVLAKAKKQNLLYKPEKDYTEQEIFNFLLMPGFSTNEVVTEYSGRGVGMDVVKSTIIKNGGDISLSSELGKGTKVVCKIPLTLAIINGMKISVGETVFIIPVNNIRQSFKAKESDIVFDTEGNEIIKVRDNYYPVIRLHGFYDIDTKITSADDGIMIMVETHDLAYCVFADALIGEQQVVVKPLPLYLTQYKIKNTGIESCAILGDGSISLILELHNLYNIVNSFGAAV